MISIGSRRRFPGAAPRASARSLVRGRELVDQVAFRAHDLDAVVAGFARQRGGDGVIVDGAQDVRLAHAARDAGIDGRGDGRRADVALVRPIAAGVQDLQRDSASRRVDSIRDGLVLGQLLGLIEDRRAGLHQPFLVGRGPTRDDQRHAALRPLLVEALHPLHRPVERLEPRVHGPHDDAVGEHREAEIEGLEKEREGSHRR
jgi:hypothetical protein